MSPQIPVEELSLALFMKDNFYKRTQGKASRQIGKKSFSKKISYF